MINVEICAETSHALRAARHAGADRAELCASLDVGGLTPSAGMMALAATCDIPVRVLIRPRSGPFVYDTEDVAVMARDIAQARDLGLSGVVIGASLEDGRLDRDVLARLSEASGALSRTLHRAFDLTPDPFEGLELAIDLGFDAILTSGQAPTAAEGVAKLRALTAQATGRIAIIAASGVTPENVTALIAATGVRSVHASCRSPIGGAPTLDPFGFGSGPAPVDVMAMRRLVATAKQAESDGPGQKLER